MGGERGGKESLAGRPSEDLQPSHSLSLCLEVRPTHIGTEMEKTGQETGGEGRTDSEEREKGVRERDGWLAG